MSSPLNPRAPTFTPTLCETAKSFFTTLFQSWEQQNVDYIVTKLPILSFIGIEQIFKELFNVLFDWGCCSEIHVNVRNVVESINSLDSFAPELLISGIESMSEKEIIDKYILIRVNELNKCLDKVENLFNLFIQTRNNTVILEASNVLHVISGLVKVRNNQDYVYAISTFLWRNFNYYEGCEEIRLIIMEILNKITDHIKRFILWTIDDVSNSEKHRDFAVQLFDNIKNYVIESKFKTQEMIYVLEILDKRNRYIGKYADAIPENKLHNNYVLRYSSSKAVENDEFYSDYEKFLSESFSSEIMG